MSEFEAAVVAEAQRWLGTPYRHQASLRGAGCDCLGLIRGVWRTILGAEPEMFPHYTRDWGESGGHEHLLMAADRHLCRVSWPIGHDRRLRPGCILVFRMRERAVAKHAGIVSADRKMIHAQEACGVVEVSLGPWWLRRVCAAYSFPENLNG